MVQSVGVEGGLGGGRPARVREARGDDRPGAPRRGPGVRAGKTAQPWTDHFWLVLPKRQASILERYLNSCAMCFGPFQASSFL